MFEKISGKKVEIEVAYMPNVGTGPIEIKTFRGTVDDCYSFGGESFLVLSDGPMINMKYVLSIKII